MIILLVAQYLFGMWVSLYCSVPPQRGSLGGAVGWSVAHGSTMLAIHAVLGMLMVVMAISLVVRAAVAKDRFFQVLSALGLAFIAGAAYNGAAFVQTGENAHSMYMATLWACALLAFVVPLFAERTGHRADA